MTETPITTEALTYVTEHGPVTEMDLVAAVPRLLGKPVLAMLQHMIRTGKIAITYDAKPEINDGKTYRIFSIPKVEVPNKMNSVLRTGPKYGPGAHGGPIRDIREVPQDSRPRITLPDIARAVPTENVRVPPAKKVAPSARQSVSSIESQTPASASSEDAVPEIWLSGSGRLRIQARNAAVELNASETRSLFRLLSGAVFGGDQNATE
jgi:hypothetical protein